MSEVAERGQRIVSDFLKRQSEEGGGNANADPLNTGPGFPEIAAAVGGHPGPTRPGPLNIGSAFLGMTTRMMANPGHLVQAQLGFWQDYLTLWQNTARRIMGEVGLPVISEDSRERRFQDEGGRGAG